MRGDPDAVKDALGTIESLLVVVDARAQCG